MRTKEQIADYQKMYKKIHYDRLRVYRTLWRIHDRRKKRGLSYDEIHLKDIPKNVIYIRNRKYNRLPNKIPDFKCQRCEILLESKLAGKHNDIYCENCLNDTN